MYNFLPHCTFKGCSKFKNYVILGNGAWFCALTLSALPNYLLWFVVHNLILLCCRMVRNQILRSTPWCKLVLRCGTEREMTLKVEYLGEFVVILDRAFGYESGQ
jgi:hypothetical protein